MNEERLDELLKEAAHTYRVAPEPPPLDEMWSAIERETFDAAPRTSPWTVWMRTGIGIAAALTIGFVAGRGSTNSTATPFATVAERTESADHAQSPVAIEGAFHVAASEYLGQTAALLISMPVDMRGGAVDQAFVSQAVDLLSTTRLLLDSPAASDPRMRQLLDDLELVLAQIARLPANSARRTPGELELIAEAMEQREVLPRLRTVAAELPHSE